MARVVWTDQAADDLEAITEFIANDSPHYAKLFAIRVIEAISRLADFPNLGRKIPEYNDPLVREIILGNYRIVYRLKNEIVQILTIFNGARLIN